MEILFDSVNVKLPEFDYKVIKTWLTEVATENSKKIKALSLIFCDDAFILKTNQKFLNHDYYTDIITFDYSKKSYISGDLIISIDTVLSNSKIFKVDFFHELCRVMVHGVLHLLSFDDKTDDDKKVKRDKENYYLQKLNFRFIV